MNVRIFCGDADPVVKEIEIIELKSFVDFIQKYGIENEDDESFDPVKVSYNVFIDSVDIMCNEAV